MNKMADEKNEQRKNASQKEPITGREDPVARAAKDRSIKKSGQGIVNEDEEDDE